MMGWSALPMRDRRLLEWLWTGDVMTADLAAALAYGNLRVAQRRLSRLIDYGILRGFWAANMQRPRGRYTYALTNAARQELETLIWAGDVPSPDTDKVQAPSPVIHQLATHDLLIAFLRASPATEDTGLAAWIPERAAALAYRGYVRPDAIAVFRAGDRATLLVVERDLGTERRDILRAKVDRQSSKLYRPLDGSLGLIVESARRAAAVRSFLQHNVVRRNPVRERPIPTWVVDRRALLVDPYGAAWRSPDGREATVLTMPACELLHELPILSAPVFALDDADGALDDRALRAIRWRA